MYRIVYNKTHADDTHVIECGDVEFNTVDTTSGDFRVYINSELSVTPSNKYDPERIDLTLTRIA